MSIHEKIDEQTGLAKSYAEDGAFLSAARVLRQLATDIEAHVQWADNLTVGVDRGAPGHDVTTEVLARTEPNGDLTILDMRECPNSVTGGQCFEQDVDASAPGYTPNLSKPEPVFPDEPRHQRDY